MASRRRSPARWSPRPHSKATRGLRCFDVIGTWLERGMAQLAAVLDPGMFVLGGGVSAAGELLRGPAGAIPSSWRSRPLDPGMFVLGGGVSAAGELLRGPAGRALLQHLTARRHDHTASCASPSSVPKPASATSLATAG